MTLNDYCQHVLSATKIEDKLIPPPAFVKLSHQDKIYARGHVLKAPKKKFPKNLNSQLNRAKVLHSFANHELLAIDVMCLTLLRFGGEKNFVQGVLKTLREEQKHFSMYRKRIQKLGFDFGDWGESDLLWKWPSKVKSREEYLAVMALTFEGANLDFMKSYSCKFLEVGDLESVKILEEVYKDEISHVAFGYNSLVKTYDNKFTWEIYKDLLPFPLTPARAKGTQFDLEGRRRSGISDDFIKSLKNYRDDFSVTDRKEWKN